jgi:hypothetical protein
MNYRQGRWFGYLLLWFIAMDTCSSNIRSLLSHMCALSIEMSCPLVEFAQYHITNYVSLKEAKF